jgi:glycosyltransferase involved in cell wall biosynthesis
LADSALRVAYLCEHPTLLGGERSLLEFLRHRGAAGVEPIVVAPADGALASALANAAVAHLPWPDARRRRVGPLVELLRERAVDLVHANSLSTADAALELGEELSRPSLAHVRDMVRLSSAQARRLGRHDAVIAVSDAVARWLGELGLPPARVHRIFNAVDGVALCRLARPGALRQELGIGDAPLVVSIGQIALRKGQDLLLAAVARLAGEFPDLRTAIAGARYSAKIESREFERQLYERTKAPDLAGRVCFLGYRDDVPALLADADVLVIPSRQEPLSRTLLEGLALGVPAVATNVGGNAEILADGQFGLLAPPDEAALAEAIRALLRGPELRQRFRAMGPERIRVQFAPQRQWRAVRMLYEGILGWLGRESQTRRFDPGLYI